MKKIIYITAAIFLGILLQFIVHAAIEIWYIRLLLADFQKYGFGFSWAEWVALHNIATIILFVAGVTWGFLQGHFWWRKIYPVRTPPTPTGGIDKSSR